MNNSKSRSKMIQIITIILFSFSIVSLASCSSYNQTEEANEPQFNDVVLEVNDIMFDESIIEAEATSEENEEIQVACISEEDESKTDISTQNKDSECPSDTDEETEETKKTEETEINSSESCEVDIVYIDSSKFKQDGVWYDSRYRYTYYSSQVLYHYRTSEWTAGQDGIYRDSNGYVVVSSSDLSQGTIIQDTPFGDCKVYDSGCASGTIDVYVNW